MSEGATCDFQLFISFDLPAASRTRTAGKRLVSSRARCRGWVVSKTRMGNSESSNGMDIHRAIASTIVPFQN